MAGKPVLHYFSGRGRMQSIRMERLLPAAGVEFEEKFRESPEDVEKLKNGKTNLMFQQVPMVEMDGMKLVQTTAILSYIATKYDLYGKDMKERALIDMYAEGLVDLLEMIWSPLLCPQEKDAKIALLKDRTVNRYLPVFENVLKSHGQDYLVGNRLSKADIHLLEVLLYIEELDASLLATFPLLQALRTRISNLMNVKKFLQPGSLRKPCVTAKEVEEERKIFKF
ncbi:glutathione S-transferase A2-like isoform X1 [Castor canadensis]|uniref:Glutathione S-transferase n=1 Tax=Castor canadensis TaxID=51338 RepID=A0A8B7VZQ6_CASCN|nr:glutathione S-transferase A2-like isoform X2 [Castor canadensis]